MKLIVFYWLFSAVSLINSKNLTNDDSYLINDDLQSKNENNTTKSNDKEIYIWKKNDTVDNEKVNLFKNDELKNYNITKLDTFQLSDEFKIKGRARRRDHRLLGLIFMGLMVIASILIPTGFQFLTVLGGKSLLMAKMALIMSAISGLKKIATSNIGYGFYQAGHDGYHHDRVHNEYNEKFYQTNDPNQVYQF